MNAMTVYRREAASQLGGLSLLAGPRLFTAKPVDEISTFLDDVERELNQDVEALSQRLGSLDAIDVQNRSLGRWWTVFGPFKRLFRWLRDFLGKKTCSSCFIMALLMWFILLLSIYITYSEGNLVFEPALMVPMLLFGLGMVIHAAIKKLEGAGSMLGPAVKAHATLSEGLRLVGQVRELLDVMKADIARNEPVKVSVTVPRFFSTRFFVDGAAANFSVECTLDDGNILSLMQEYAFERPYDKPPRERFLVSVTLTGKHRPPKKVALPKRLGPYQDLQLTTKDKTLELTGWFLKKHLKPKTSSYQRLAKGGCMAGDVGHLLQALSFLYGRISKPDAKKTA